MVSLSLRLGHTKCSVMKGAVAYPRHPRQAEGRSDQIREFGFCLSPERGDSVKPVVERSGTPGSVEHKGTAREAGSTLSCCGSPLCAWLRAGITGVITAYEAAKQPDRLIAPRVAQRSVGSRVFTTNEPAKLATARICEANLSTAPQAPFL
jgi:hypothetical protein